MSVMIGGVTERLAPDSDFMIWDNVSNASIVDTNSRDEERVRVAALVTFVSGLFQVKVNIKQSYKTLEWWEICTSGHDMSIIYSRNP